MQATNDVEDKTRPTAQATEEPVLPSDIEAATKSLSRTNRAISFTVSLNTAEIATIALVMLQMYMRSPARKQAPAPLLSRRRRGWSLF